MTLNAGDKVLLLPATSSLLQWKQWTQQSNTFWMRFGGNFRRPSLPSCRACILTPASPNSSYHHGRSDGKPCAGQQQGKRHITYALSG